MTAEELHRAVEALILVAVEPVPAGLLAELLEEPVDRVEAACAAFDRAMGRLDAVYGVAGISGRRYGDGPLHEATLEGWETVLATNATSQFLVVRAAVRRMLAQPPGDAGLRGAVLLMSSTLATHPAPAYFATHAYAASKGAIEAMTRALAAYYGPHGIRVNAIAPGAIQTPINRKAWDTPQALNKLLTLVPDKRIGQPEDIGRAAVWLASDAADYGQGTTLYVDGGHSLA